MNHAVFCLRKIALLATLLISCSDSTVGDEPIPLTPFAEIYINLTLPQYTALLTDGGYIYNNDGGTRGLILYRKDKSTYLAFERNCSYLPNEACATVNVDESKLFMIDPCCDSSFSFSDGSPIGGPASLPLIQYRTRLDENDLYITDETVD